MAAVPSADCMAALIAAITRLTAVPSANKPSPPSVNTGSLVFPIAFGVIVRTPVDVNDARPSVSTFFVPPVTFTEW